MKRVLIVSVALLALVGGAWPADVAAQTDYKWQGFYVGANLGGAAGGSDHGSNLSGVDTYYAGIPGLVPQINSAAKQDLSTSGVIGGVQGGYNYMLGNVLLGAELDFNAFPQSGTQSTTQSFNCPVPSNCVFSTYSVKTTVSTDWLLTLRPRFGYALGRFLPYVTGGLAVTDLSAKWRFTDTFTSANERAEAWAIKPGWTAGFGFEVAVTQNWTIKGEYLYVNFGKLFSTGVASYPCCSTSSVVISNFADLHSNIGRVGLNYKF
jgi:outer membrane immunogenic protein